MDGNMLTSPYQHQYDSVTRILMSAYLLAVFGIQVATQLHLGQLAALICACTYMLRPSSGAHLRDQGFFIPLQQERKKCTIDRLYAFDIASPHRPPILRVRLSYRFPCFRLFGAI